MVAALAALADSPSRLTGIGHLRLHETDRLAALATEITALGGDVTELADGLEIRPAAAARRRVRQLRRPPAGHGRRRARPRGARRRGGERGHLGKTLPGLHQLWPAMLEGAP